MSERRVIYRGRVIELGVEQVTLPDGTRFELELVRHPGGAAIVALDADGRVCLLRQYRHAAGGWLWELPAGKIDNREPPLETARRELAEEAGVEAGEWQPLGIMHSSPGVFAETIHLFLARALVPVGHAHEEHEIIEVHWVPFAEALERAREGQISDAKSVCGLFRATRWMAECRG